MVGRLRETVYLIGLPFLILFFQGCQIFPDRIRPPWGMPALIVSDNKTGATFSAPIALDRAGNGIVVWVQSDGSNTNLWADRYEAGKGWGIPALIGFNTGTSADPRIAMDPFGNAIVVWQQFTGGQGGIYANWYESGKGWGTATAISAGSGNASAPQLALDDAGNALVVWRQFNGTTHQIYSNRYEAGAGWKTAASIGANDGTALEPQSAMFGDGRAMAVWPAWDGHSYRLWTNRYEKGSGWSGASLIEAAIEDSLSPRLAVNPAAGTAIVVWSRFESEAYTLYASRYDPAKGWETAYRIGTHPDDAVYPDAAMDRHGNVVVVWVQRRCIERNCLYSNVWANRFVAGKGWDTAMRLAEKAYDPQVAFDGRGNATAIWGHYGWRYAAFWACHYENGAGWQKPTRIGLYTGNLVEHPSIAVNETGIAVAAWNHFENGVRRIWSNRYEPTPVETTPR